MIQRVLISIDVEAPLGQNGVEKLVYGRIGNELFGIDRLMDLFDDKSVRGLFFVDICEAWEYGKDDVVDVLKHIASRGHDVGVHVHPDRMADKKRRYLWQYSFEEQYEIIKKATDLYIEALGKKPLSFRAGRYGADDNTLLVLKKLGYKIDMSFFYGKKSCKISKFKGYNKLQMIDGVLEVPVTSFTSFKLFNYRKYEKTDCSLNHGEFKFFNKKLFGKVDVLSFFAHSFSLLKWRTRPDSPLFSKRMEKRFISNLSFLTKNDSYSFISERDILSLDIEEKEENEPNLSRGLRPFFYFLRTVFKVLINRIQNNV